MNHRSNNRGGSWNPHRNISKTLRASHGARNADGETRIISVGDGGASERLQTNSSGSGSYATGPVLPNKTFNGIFMVNRDTAYAVGDSGAIVRTSNGGAAWSVQSSGTNAHLRGVAFRDANNGFTVGLGGVIRRTTNGGTTWTAVAGIPANDLHGISFASTSIGIAVGASGTILRTTNGGGSWQTVVAPTSMNLNGVDFANNTRGAIVGDGGTILGTNNGGSTWSPQQSSSTQTLHAVAFFNDTVGVAVGAQGTILRTTGGVTWVEWKGTTPAEYELAQNYPNPFNPSTTIRYGLPRASAVRLTLYNALGQQVAVLQHGEREAGFHEVPFDGRHLPSGAYFYRLVAGDYVETKRLLLIR